jgi:hypothetical protein
MYKPHMALPNLLVHYHCKRDSPLARKINIPGFEGEIHSFDGPAWKSDDEVTLARCRMDGVGRGMKYGGYLHLPGSSGKAKCV